MMRRILVDHAKAQSAAKRGAGATCLALEESLAVTSERNVDLLSLDEALHRLSRMDPQRGRIVELRFFGGLSNEESAVVLGVSPATVQRQWSGARAWLFHELTSRPPE
jgi:RNA polymerase sigma factor (TIGR02999 family)